MTPAAVPASKLASRPVKKFGRFQQWVKAFCEMQNITTVGCSKVLPPIGCDIFFQFSVVIEKRIITEVTGSSSVPTLPSVFACMLAGQRTPARASPVQSRAPQAAPSLQMSAGSADDEEMNVGSFTAQQFVRSIS